MKHVIVGTAGHIDHGKTALIAALTGTNTDRLKEEQQRGITIDLGFAFLSLSNDIELGIIDVPGHERFVKNMLAGIGGIDLAVLVIAADEGVMPQTEEHLAICDLLNIQQGVVALTKIDLVDEEWLELVIDDIQSTLVGTFLEQAPVIPVSSKTGEGLEPLKEALARIAENVQERRTDGVFRLPIDRVFTIKGFGTVVTGTLISGKVKPEDTVEILPQQMVTRVRNVQVHDTNVPAAYAGQRTALNVHGMEKRSIQRGDVLSEPDVLRPTYMLDASLSLLASARRPLKHRSRVRFHHGTSEILARVVLFDREELTPGEQAYVQLRLEAPAVVMARDRYIVRSYSPAITIGGGDILHTHPKKHKRSAAVISHLETLQHGSLEAIVEQYVAQAQYVPITAREIAGQVAFAEQEIAATLHRLLQRQAIVNTGDREMSVIHDTHYRALTGLVIKILEQFHQNSPLKSGMAQGELRRKLPDSVLPQVFQQILDEQETAGHLEVSHNLVRQASHQITLSIAQRQIKQRLEAVYRRAQYQPPGQKDALRASDASKKESEDMLQLLIDDGTLVRVEQELFYHKDVLADMVTKVKDYLTRQPQMTVGDVKDLFQISRKYAVPLLAYLDANGVTIRKGDVRVLRTA